LQTELPHTTPLLIFGNKMDRPDCVPLQELAAALGVERINEQGEVMEGGGDQERRIEALVQTHTSLLRELVPLVIGYLNVCELESDVRIMGKLKGKLVMTSLVKRVGYATALKWLSEQLAADSWLPSEGWISAGR
jgi:hypothetical protein